MRYCDNISDTHDNVILSQTDDGVRVMCQKCKQQQVIRIGTDGRMDNRLYSKVFKADILQPSENLYFKLHSEQMSII